MFTFYFGVEAIFLLFSLLALGTNGFSLPRAVLGNNCGVSCCNPAYARMIVSRLSSQTYLNSDSRSESSLVNSDIKSQPDWAVDLLFDSECPICMMEVEFLKKRDIHNKIRFTDLQSPDYIPSEHGNVQFADGMRKIRAVLPDQTVVMGVEVFRRTYEAIGLGWVFELTKLPIIGQIADNFYDIWAENRLKLTGRGDLAEVLKERAAKLRDMGEVDCNEDGCGIDYDD